MLPYGLLPFTVVLIFMIKSLANASEIVYNREARRNDGIGRRAGLKIQWWRHRAGSTPASGTRP